MASVRSAMQQRSVHPARVVVLLPYVQLIPVARSSWTRLASTLGVSSCFMPRFETSMNWTRSLKGFAPTGDDLRMDPARDLLTAASLLQRSGIDAGLAALATTLMESAWSIARVAAAVPPEQRSAWGAERAMALVSQGQGPALELETRLGQTAVAWAANSAYRSDCLFSAQADLLVLVQGLQVEPLHATLHRLWGDRALLLALEPVGEPGLLALQQALDMEDEAQRAAACVLNHLSSGRLPVALVAQDRLVTRRVRAMLGDAGVAVRDETGWTLSTTRAAASVMGLLRAAAWDAPTDVVLDWAKNAPALEASPLVQLETSLRRRAVREWQQVASVDGTDGTMQRISDMREGLRGARPLALWLEALRLALQASGQWQSLVADAAGQAVLDALHLHPDTGAEFSGFTQRLGQNVFVAWVGQVLEAGSFQPPHPELAQVLILPLSQLLGRVVGAVVLPGCDEQRLSASPEPPGIWTPAQRLLLGLPSRDQAAAELRAAWRYALHSPHIDVLWRASEAGERLMPSTFVQELLHDGCAPAPDPRIWRALNPRPSRMPQPSAADLPLAQLSPSAYHDLRLCPYRFFALRQLGLQESDEIDTGLGKRDFGNWLHWLLRHFHEALAAAPTPDQEIRLQLLDAAAQSATAELGLAQSEFLPFAASWPQVRTAYLTWLAQHEASGARFAQAEVSKQMRLGALVLTGRIDRIDRLGDGSALVIDYKTEARSKTSERIRHPAEDTQLAFYAALLEDDTLAAQYVNIGETEATRAYPLLQIVALRDQLVQGVQDDMARIAAGAALPAIGEGQACDYCAARGLCRKDFWDTELSGAPVTADV